MPRLANDRHELYCLHRAKGMIPKKAAIAAGFATGSSIYTALEDDADVVARIAELTHEIQAKKEAQLAAARESAKMVGQITGVTKAWVIQQLAENAIKARQEGMIEESNSALKMIGDEFGMFKGTSGKEDDGRGIPQHVDLDKTEALLDTAGEFMALPGTDKKEDTPVSMETLERLLGTTSKVPAKDRVLSTGSETDVALTADADIEDEEEE